MASVLVIEDSTLELYRYVSFLKKLDHDVTGISSLAEAKQILAQRSYDYVITDLHLSIGSETPDGYEVLSLAKELNPNVVTMALSFDPKPEVAKKVVELGASSFVKKPLESAEEFSVYMSQAKENDSLKKQNKILSKEKVNQKLFKYFPLGMVVQESETRVAMKLSQNPSIPITIYGETGTGKEEIAKLIRRFREEKEGSIPFVSVNCANLKGDLVASLLFGHKKGAFTGANESSSGYIGDANGGILFLDEVHLLNTDCQKRLLRVLNDGKYTRVGDTVELESKFQIITASTVNLEDKVAQGSFSIDVFMRLTGFNIELKPLRQRLEQVAELIDFFFLKKQISLTEEVKKDLVERCKRYYWQGNIRQLFKVLDLMIINCSLSEVELSAAFLPQFKTMFSPEMSSIKPDKAQKCDFSSRIGGASTNCETEDAVSVLERFLAEPKNFNDVVAKIEKEMIRAVIEKTNSLQEAYELIGVSRSTLDNKRKKYEL